MLSRYDVVRASTERARSFAMVGLLRQVKEATPLDMVCTYIIQTNQPWGLRDRVDDLDWSKRDRTYCNALSIRGNANADRLRRFPEGIVKMSKDYLIRMFWKQIDHLRSQACMHVSASGIEFTKGDYRTGWCPTNVMRTYPRAVLDALAACHIHHNSRLWDAQHAIGALHAVCTPLMLDRPSWVRPGCGFEADKRQFDTMKGNHSRAIACLESMLNDYCWNTNNRSHIPNDAEKNILLDLIECFLVMFGPESFANSFRARQVYEYCRIGDVMSNQSCGCRRCGCGESADVSSGEVGYNSWARGRHEIFEKLKHLSPETAICAGRLIDSYMRDLGTCVEVMREINPQPSKEVELFLRAEFEVQIQKEKASEEIRKQISEGRYGDDDRYNGRCSCEPCEPAPCGY